ncbi:MAG TPA: hypothetical protein VKA60_10620 [Blastocatellia bacterium]|nr:hypothetical protein [Blastocatellia bacterium]
MRKPSDDQQQNNAEKRHPRRAIRRSAGSLRERAEYFTVHYLPNYEQDYRHDPHAEAVKLGDFPSAATLEDEIRSAPDFVPGYYRITAIDKDKRILKSWPMQVPGLPESYDDEVQVEGTERAQRDRVVIERGIDVGAVRDLISGMNREMTTSIKEIVAAIPKPTTQAPVNVVAEAIKQLKDYQELQQTLMPGQGAPGQPVQNSLNPAIGELSLLIEVLKLSKETKDPSIVEVLRDVIAPKKETGWGDKLIDMLGTALQSPMVNNLVGRLMMSATKPAPAAPPVAQVAAPPPRAQRELTAPPGESPAAAQSESPAPPPAAPAPPIDPAERAWRVVFSHVLDNCWLNMGIVASAEQIVDLIEAYPQFAEFISVLVKMTPEAVLDLLVEQMPGAENIKALPHAVQWIAEVQKEVVRIFAEMPDEQEAADDAPPNAQAAAPQA